MNSSSSNQVTAPQLIKELNLSKATFMSWVRRGKMEEAIIARPGKQNKGYLFDYDTAIHIIQGYTDVKIKPSPGKRKKIVDSAESALESDEDDIEQVVRSASVRNSDAPTVNKARAMKEAYQAQIARLDYEERSNRLVDVDAVVFRFNKAARVIRNNFLSIPGRIASELSGMQDARSIENLITKEMMLTLEGLQNVDLSFKE